MIKSLYMPFQKWSEKGSVYIISDPHFEDTNCKLIDANWPTPQEYIKNINKKTTKNDTLICLGDCGNLEWFNKIKAGNKILIKGNHDDKSNNLYLKNSKLFYFEKEYTKYEVQCLMQEQEYKIIDIIEDEHCWLLKGEKGYFDEVYDGPLLIAPKILLSHEPIEELEWCINIHGHDHKGETSGINLAANIYNYQLFNLGEEIKKGLVSKIDNIHRITIDKSIERINMR